MLKVCKAFKGITAASIFAVAVVPVTGCRAKAPAVDDTSLNAAVQSRLQSDPGLAGQPVQEAVQDGVVTLSGNVSNEAARSLAANDAAEVSGVRTVVNNLQLGAPATTPAVVASPGRPIEPLPARRTIEKQKIATIPIASSQPGSQPAPVDRRYPTDAQQAPAAPVRAQQPPAFRNVTVPAGTGLSVRITQTLDSGSTQPGSSFSGVLASDVIVDGTVAFPSGTHVTGHVDDAKDAGHFSGNSLLAISLTGIDRRGEKTEISTDTFSKEGKGRGKNTAEKIGGGAAVGAILGGIFGGGKGAAIGAGAGGGLGAGANGVTRGEQVQIASEELVRFRLTSPIAVRVSSQPDTENGNNDLRHHEQ
jgi:hypothetical protein